GGAGRRGAGRWAGRSRRHLPRAWPVSASPREGRRGGGFRAATHSSSGRGRSVAAPGRQPTHSERVRQTYGTNGRSVRAAVELVKSYSLIRRFHDSSVVWRSSP